MSVAELVRVRGQKSYDFCYRNNQIAHGIHAQRQELQHHARVVAIMLRIGKFLLESRRSPAEADKMCTMKGESPDSNRKAPHCFILISPCSTNNVSPSRTTSRPAAVLAITKHALRRPALPGHPTCKFMATAAPLPARPRQPEARPRPPRSSGTVREVGLAWRYMRPSLRLNTVHDLLSWRERSWR